MTATEASLIGLLIASAGVLLGARVMTGIGIGMMLAAFVLDWREGRDG